DKLVKNFKKSSEQVKVKFLILDFKEISGIDYSACETFQKIKDLLYESRIYLILSSLEGPGPVYESVKRSGILSENEEEVKLDLDIENNNSDTTNFTPCPKKVVLFSSLDEALEWSENLMLKSYYHKIKQLESLDIPKAKLSDTHLPRGESMMTPRYRQVLDAAETVLREELNTKSTIDDSVTSILIETFSAYSSSSLKNVENAESNSNIESPKNLNAEKKFLMEKNELKEIVKYFFRVEVGRSTVLWNVGDLSDSIFVIESGELELQVNDRKIFKVVETLLRGGLVGELEVFSQQPRTCRLIASVDSVLWKMSKDDFDTFSLQNPLLANRFTRMALTHDSC
ncbi:hypothetical protein HK099_002824, partial [Clydaea vesicula]